MTRQSISAAGAAIKALRSEIRPCAANQACPCLQHKFDVRPLDAVLAAGADINLAGKTGITPIDIALAFGNFDVAQLLIDRGADPEPTRQRAAKKPQELSDSGGKPEAIAWQQRVMALGRK